TRAHTLDRSTSPTRRSSDLMPGKLAQRVQMVDRDTEKTVHLRRMQGHRQNAVRPGGDQEIGNQASTDRDPRRVLLVGARVSVVRSEEHTSELQSRVDLVCRL